MRGLTIVALASGALIGLLLGGRAADLARRPLRWPWAVVVGVGAQAAAVATGATGSVATVAVVTSYVGLAAFAAANLALLGMAVVLVGLALNAAVMALNGGMPVQGDAVEAAGGPPPARLTEGDFGPKHHLAGPDTRLAALGDRIPLRPTGEVVSVGDIVMAAGVAAVLVQLLRPAGRGRDRRPAGDPPQGIH